MVVLVRRSSKVPSSSGDQSPELRTKKKNWVKFSTRFLGIGIERVVSIARSNEIYVTNTFPTFFIFGDFSRATQPGFWTIFDLWFFEEWTNEIIPQDTNLIFEKHIKAI